MDTEVSRDKLKMYTPSIIAPEPRSKRMGLAEMLGLKSNVIPIIAGPCGIESKEQLKSVGNYLKSKSMKLMRGGAYKPRTSPYSFQGLGEEGLEILREVGEMYDLITVTEVLDVRDVDIVAKYADVLQIGARNMFNYQLLKEVGRQNKPVLLKRGVCATVMEFLYAAEYIAAEGNKKIILCERGIRTYETSTRYTLDISSIPIIKKEIDLPIIADISHSLGRKDIISPVAKAVFAAGADGIMVEVHPNPKEALSDGFQQLDFMEFTSLLEGISSYLKAY
ncbi:bifunctional 3-deoxy-7-phosphoheptulonate synthase/chorismate mutase [Alkaliphilus peptidifermentans]|uniref:3-deoxy-D-arabinoheptulosonate-7-phosphate synthase n=1 Tax=Alkaliphilus peptidifermentans DSM 18978 TaxID=1120976 RepID=A0A1G5K6K4_9FIRM|nr:bifunctional 3-deoxy-7-phosphoheptulonate synthase/chorismate mutase [Alkaliphilus peptidifermentans]SCY96226.1 3-deoxy-D-arabinoheptulosonate-7-phosphate synthase [Alkaliphilus peptidifermentans DSM 18978]